MKFLNMIKAFIDDNYLTIFLMMYPLLLLLCTVSLPFTVTSLSIFVIYVGYGIYKEEKSLREEN